MQDYARRTMERGEDLSGDFREDMHTTVDTVADKVDSPEGPDDMEAFWIVAAGPEGLMIGGNAGGNEADMLLLDTLLHGVDNPLPSILQVLAHLPAPARERLAQMLMEGPEGGGGSPVETPDSR